MKEAQSFSETSVLTRTTRRDIPEDAILYVSASRCEGVVKFVLSVSLDAGHMYGVNRHIRLLFQSEQLIT
jgi:hypothetical protein